MDYIGNWYLPTWILVFLAVASGDENIPSFINMIIDTLSHLLSLIP